MPSAVDKVLSARWWPELVQIKDTNSYAALAERFGAPLQAIRAALLRAGLQKTAMPRGPKPRAAEPAPEVPTPGERSPDQQLRELAGTMPDPQVAERLALTPEEVKAFRRTHDIAPYLRPPPGPAVARQVQEPTPSASAAPALKPSQAPVVLRRRKNAKGTTEQVAHRHVWAPEPVPPAQVEPEAATGPKSPVPRSHTPVAARKHQRPVRSVLDAFRGAMGAVSDGDIATRAGVRISAVQAYRTKLGIAAYAAFRSRPRTKTTPEVGKGPAPSPHRRPPSSAPPSSAQPSGAPPNIRSTTRRKPDGQSADYLGAETALGTGVAVAEATAYREHRDVEQPTYEGLEAGGRSVPPARSRIAPFADKLGIVPDSELAALAGVKRAAVERKRRGIGGYVPPGEKDVGMRGGAPFAKEAPREDAPSVIAPAPSPTMEGDATPTGHIAPASGRRSKLEPFAHLIGKVHDTEIARMAGVIPGSVQVYRSRHGIAASWLVRDTPVAISESGRPSAALVITPAPAGHQDVHPEAIQVAEAPAAPALPTAPELAGMTSARAMGYRVTARRGEETRRFVVVADDLVIAVERAVTALDARRDGPWVLVCIRILAEALE